MSTSSVEITLGTNNAALKSGLAAARGQVEGFKSQTSAMLMGLFSGIGIEQLLEKFGHIQDQADAFGTTAEAVQRVDQLAQQAGSSIDDVAKAMAKLRINSDGLGKLGIDQGEFIAADMDQQLLMVAEALGKIEDPAQRVNMAIEVFGARMAGKILPMLNMGAEEMRAFFDGAIVASNETVAQLDAAGDRLTELKNIVTVGVAGFFGFLANLWQSIEGGLMGVEVLFINIFSRIADAMSSLFSGDFSGMKVALSAMLDDAKGGLKDIVSDVTDPFSKGLTGVTNRPKIKKGLDTEADGEGGGAGAGGKRLSVAERIAAIEEEHRLKQLDAQERLNELTEKRLSLEQQLSQIGSGNAEKKKQLEDQLVATAREQLATQDEIERNAKKADEERIKAILKEQEEWSKQQEKEKAAAAKAMEDADKLAAKKDKEADRAKMDSLRAQERDLGFVSGIKQVGESGQRLAGVDYSVINAEAEKGIKLQEEMRDLMKIMAEKEYKLELPDAS